MTMPISRNTSSIRSSTAYFALVREKIALTIRSGIFVYASSHENMDDTPMSISTAPVIYAVSRNIFGKSDHLTDLYMNIDSTKL